MKRLLLIVGLVCALGLAAAGGVVWGLRQRKAPAAAPTGPAATAEVTRATLTKSATLTGTVTFGAETHLTSAVPGMVTWLPAAGATIRRGDAVLRVNDLPVALLYGDLPLYRPLVLNAKGNDVRQFERNLAALGYRGFTVDDTYSQATVDAVKRWQHDLGRTETGGVDAGQVIVAPGKLRVSQQLVRVGGNATGDILAYTAATRKIVVPVPPDQAAWAQQGATVTVKAASGATLTGRIESVAAPTPAAATADGGAADGGSADGGAGAGAGVKDGATQPNALVTVADQDKLQQAGAGPFDVTRVLQQRKDVLTVPVAALLALAEGGYGVEIVAAPADRIVAVKPGMFADGRVEITGDGIAEGVKVGMPG